MAPPSRKCGTPPPLHSGQPTLTGSTEIPADNLLTRDGQLTAVIDFDTSGIGDPACDTVIAWTDFDAVGRAAFRRPPTINDDAWARGRGWALWKALVTLVNQREHNDTQGAARSRAVINRTVSEIA
jgi:aminoglycoside phosphotransferase (APT) family kinase protein